MRFKNTVVLRKKQSLVDKITAKLSSPPVSYRDYLDGVQVNWVVNGKSYMWRSNDCPDRVEIYTGDDYNMSYMYLDEI